MFRNTNTETETDKGTDADTDYFAFENFGPLSELDELILNCGKNSVKYVTPSYRAGGVKTISYIDPTHITEAIAQFEEGLRTNPELD